MEEHDELMLEIRDMLKVISKGQEQILENLHQLKEEQKKLQEEIRINNFVLNNIALRNEMLN
ncbi:MAG: hypothetical protein QHH06_02185 [Clostridiales bacterium]|jgi:hypothetical protein|nr:hypothetical protein [Eubacteriales bacterium]MDH7565281.1 hypothetical protein [Clostridiales bacterium]